MVEEATAELEVHEDVDVTIRARLSAGHGSEHSDVAGAVSPSDGEDLLTVGFQKRVDIHFSKANVRCRTRQRPLGDTPSRSTASRPRPGLTCV